jgi:hypothetical protein
VRREAGIEIGQLGHGLDHSASRWCPSTGR